MKISSRKGAILRVGAILGALFAFIGPTLLAADTGNTTAQEYGDAVYRKLAAIDMFVADYDYNHTGVFAGINGAGIGRVFQALGSTTTTQEVSFSEQFANYGADYYGAYTLTNHTMSFTDRKSVVKTASDLANARIPYPQDIIPYAILYFGSTFDGTIFDISNIRCDGFVEFAYERNGFRV